MSTLAPDIIQQCQLLLGPQGRLTTAIAGFTAREQQIQLAIAIAKAIQDQTILVAEAGTGTGKTFAYLIPALLSGKKVIISTATKTLQDQLYRKDLPLLVRALGLSVRVQNLKGRANYVCQYRLELHAETGRFTNPQVAHDLIHVREKLPQMVAGERGELPELSEQSPVWPYVTSTAENCLGNECTFYESCFLLKARKRALAANVVVINHHLYFADAALKESGFGELLPGAEVIIFDEAHQLAEIATNFYGQRLSTRQLSDWLEDTIREWPALDLANQPWKTAKLQLESLIATLVESLSPSEERINWYEAQKNTIFHDTLQTILNFLENLTTCFTTVSTDSKDGLQRCETRLQEFIAHLHKLLLESKPTVPVIHWLERLKHHVVLHSTPYEIGEAFQASLKQQTCAHVFTSATLTIANSFTCYINALGLKKVESLLLPSPFDFKNQALLYLPRGIPDPKARTYYECLLEKALPVIQACGGRCFFLFTSHWALQHTAALITKRLTFPLLIQGEEAKPILLARFRELGNAVLLGTATFWEGVDVKGEALSCVIIDKIPFASPVDPVIRGKMAHLQSQGLSGFDELALPHAIITLKQGVGRLIRDLDDRGVLMIGDPRLTGRSYSKAIFASLPPMRKTRDENTVLTFIEELALSHEEAISH